MAGELIKLVLSLLETHQHSPRLGPRRRVVNRNSVLERVGGGAGEAFHQMQIFGGAHKTTLRGEVRRVNHQSLPLPAPARVPVPASDFRWKMRAPVEGNDPRVVECLHKEDDVTARLHDLVVTIIACSPAPADSRHAGSDAAHRAAEILRPRRWTLE